MKILVVDDDQTSRLLLSKLLEAWGRVTRVGDGIDAVTEVLRAKRQGTPFSLLCVDRYMPHMNGPTTMRLIRNTEERLRTPPAEQVRAILTSADLPWGSAPPSGEGPCREVFLSKPFGIDSLSACMERLGLGRAPTDRPCAPDAPAGHDPARL
jgi:two-component system chemotaxis response regulator CheY